MSILGRNVKADEKEMTSLLAYMQTNYYKNKQLCGV